MHFTSSYHVSSTLFCFATRAQLCIYFLLSTATGISLSFFWQVQAPYKKIAVSVFSRIYVCVSPISPCFSELLNTGSISLPSIISSTSVSYLPKFFVDIISWFPPIPFHTFSTTVCYPITLFQLALLLHSPVQLYQLWLATSFLACSLLTLAFIQLYHVSYLFRVGTFPVLLLIPYNSSCLSILSFFSCCHLYCFQLFYELRVHFP